ncbi:hypothetical protein VMUT_1002 [Vulcanisaeta moutnovskia 768-28]|uniref:Uncharacterized protein n=1 Tax=Vulcanisaeta moutnovskia (strain 768-28) TaxID=985053 RepID=F0QXP6_VULM7|nr:hypothetical protein [Vulcanisaeta moutnovskia]ADY01209.1 hypothetical protein VMUT_1002 [Vulcanisaeta moutnovskia 768-28]
MRIFGNKGLNGLEREVKELGRLRLREIKARPVKSNGRELMKFINSWSSRCVDSLRPYCQRVLARLVNYFTPESINELLSEVLARGLSIEVALILLSQCDLIHCNELSVREYLETGRVDINELMTILNSQGIKVSPEELRAVINGEYRVNQARSRLSWLPRFIRHAF